MHVGARAGLPMGLRQSIHLSRICLGRRATTVTGLIQRTATTVTPALWKHDTLFRPLSDLPRRHPPGLSMNKRKRTPPCDPACNCKGCIVRAWRVVPARFYSLACAGRIHCVPFSDGAV